MRKRLSGLFSRHAAKYGLVIFSLFNTGKTSAQVDSIFKYPPDERLFNLWIIAEVDLFKSQDSTLVFNKLDTVINLAQKNNDERLLWYARYFKQLYHGRKWHDVKKEIVEMKQMKDWIDHCPIEVIKASYQHILGNLLFIDLQFTEAFDLLLKAQKTFEKIGFENIPEVGQYIYQLGADYYFFEDYAKSLGYLRQAEKYPSYIARVNINNQNTQGLIYQRQKNYQMAREKFLSTIELAKKYRDTVWTGIASGNYGYTLSLEGKYGEAKTWLLQDYNLNSVVEPQNTAITCLYLANCYTYTGDLVNAKFFFERGLQLEGQLNDPAFYKHYYQMKADYFAKLGDNSLAYRYTDSVVKFSDSLKLMFNNNILASAERRIEAEVYLANSRLAEEQQRTHALKRNIIIVIIAAVLCLLLLLLYQKNKMLQRDKKLMAQSQLLLNVEKAMIEEKLKSAEIQLNGYLKNISEKNDLIEHITAELKNQQPPGNASPNMEKLEKLNELMQFTILTEEDWKNFKQLFDKVHPIFFIGIKDRFPTLTPAETRLLALLKLNISHREMSSMLGVSSDTITKSKYRLRKKITELDADMELDQLVATL